MHLATHVEFDERANSSSCSSLGKTGDNGQDDKSDSARPLPVVLLGAKYRLCTFVGYHLLHTGTAMSPSEHPFNARTLKAICANSEPFEWRVSDVHNALESDTELEPFANAKVTLMTAYRRNGVRPLYEIY